MTRIWGWSMRGNCLIEDHKPVMLQLLQHQPEALWWPLWEASLRRSVFQLPHHIVRISSLVLSIVGIHKRRTAERSKKKTRIYLKMMLKNYAGCIEKNCKPWARWHVWFSSKWKNGVLTQCYATKKDIQNKKKKLSFIVDWCWVYAKMVCKIL